MIDQESASIIHFVLGVVPEATPLYYEIPENFAVPAIYFPSPEISLGGDTFFSYNARVSWRIQAFHSRSDLAYTMARKIADALMYKRRLVPLRGEDGNIIPGKGIRLEDPEAQVVDLAGVGGAAEVTLTWNSRRPYEEKSAVKMVEFHVDFNDKGTASAPETSVGGDNNR